MRHVIRMAVLGGGLFLLSGLCAVLLVPHISAAAQMDADAMCTPVKMECGCMMIMGPNGCIGGPNMFMCPCFDVTSGFTTSGKCLAPFKCKGESVGGMAPMLPMIPMMMPKMDMMMMPQDPCLQSGAPTSSCGGSYGGGYFDPWNGFGDTGSSSSWFFDDLTAPSDETVDDFLPQATGTPTTTGGNSGQTTVTPTTTSQLTGAIKIGEFGAAVVSNLREGASEIAGFFGGTTFGGSGAQSVAGRLCASRPWASSPISKIIPNTFFDTLCARAGYQVGVTVPTEVSDGDAVSPPPRSGGAATTTPRPIVDLGPVELEIWAEPSSVRLGTRTYIFWRSQGVLDCTVSGPNFTQQALAGGASTVPISGPTTYTLTCNLPNGTSVSDTVTVQLAL